MTCSCHVSKYRVCVYIYIYILVYIYIYILVYIYILFLNVLFSGSFHSTVDQKDLSSGRPISFSFCHQLCFGLHSALIALAAVFHEFCHYSYSRFHKHWIAAKRAWCRIGRMVHTNTPDKSQKLFLQEAQARCRLQPSNESWKLWEKALSDHAVWSSSTGGNSGGGAFLARPQPGEARS